MARITPQRSLGLVIVAKLPRPDDLSIFNAKAKQITFGSQGVNAVAINRWSTTWPGGVTDGIADRIFVFPFQPPIVGPEAVNTLDSRERLTLEVGNVYIIGGHVIGHKDSAASDRRSCIAAVDLRAPQFLRRRIELAQAFCLSQDVVAKVAHPLHPVGSRAGSGPQDRHKQDRNDLSFHGRKTVLKQRNHQTERISASPSAAKFIL